VDATLGGGIKTIKELINNLVLYVGRYPTLLSFMKIPIFIVDFRSQKNVFGLLQLELLQTGGE
jgi:hypothetical protein